MYYNYGPGEQKTNSCMQQMRLTTAGLHHPNFDSSNICREVRTELNEGDTPNSYIPKMQHKRELIEFEGFGYIMLWPAYFKLIIFCKEMDYLNRCRAVCYAYKDGFNIELFLHLIRICNEKDLGQFKRQKCCNFWNTLDRDDEVGLVYWSRFSSYDLYNERVEYLNGVEKYVINYRNDPNFPLN